MKRNSGWILVYTISLLAALFFFAVSYVHFYYQDRALGGRTEANVLAEEAANAGIDQALYLIGQDHTWRPNLYEQQLQNSRATYRLAFEAGHLGVRRRGAAPQDDGR